MIPAEPSPTSTGPSFDPYAPPRTEPGQAHYLSDRHADRALVRLAYLDHERAIRRVSWVNFVLAVVWTPAAVGTVLMLGLMLLRAVGIDPVSYRFPKDTPAVPEFLAMTAFHVGCLAHQHCHRSGIAQASTVGAVG